MEYQDVFKEYLDSEITLNEAADYVIILLVDHRKSFDFDEIPKPIEEKLLGITLAYIQNGFSLSASNLGIKDSSNRVVKLKEALDSYFLVKGLPLVEDRLTIDK